MKNEIIGEIDCRRIAADAQIAIDCLNALHKVAHNGILHTGYVAEKARAAQRCLDFIKSFVEGE